MYVAKAALQGLILKVLYNYYRRPDANPKDYMMLQNILGFLRNNAYPYRSKRVDIGVVVCKGKSMNIVVPVVYLRGNCKFRYLRGVGE